jgi:CheY-like chemotaxis protein
MKTEMRKPAVEAGALRIRNRVGTGNGTKDFCGRLSGCCWHPVRYVLSAGMGWDQWTISQIGRPVAHLKNRSVPLTALPGRGDVLTGHSVLPRISGRSTEYVPGQRFGPKGPLPNLDESNYDMNKLVVKRHDPPAISIRNKARALRILHADDELMICRTVNYALNRAGYAVISVNDGQKAWEALRAEPFDLLITDNDMPRLSGEKLVVKMRQHGLSLPIIITSGRLDFFSAPDNQWLRIGRMFEKPFCLDELVDAVGTILRTAPQKHGMASL